MEPQSTVCQCLQKASFTLSLTKCEFVKAAIIHLCKHIDQGQLCPVDTKVTAIFKCPVSTTKQELCRFLSLPGYYQQFCLNFASIVSLLTDLPPVRVWFGK